jgi:polyhydroxyalkanoate synthesis regulator phasin
LTIISFGYAIIRIIPVTTFPFKKGECYAMRDMLHRAVSLGLGLAVASKEQIEKTVEELVKKGEVSRAESGEFLEELLNKGSEAKTRMDQTINDKVQSILKDRGIASQDEVKALERRIAVLELAIARLEQQDGEKTE